MRIATRNRHEISEKILAPAALCVSLCSVMTCDESAKTSPVLAGGVAAKTSAGLASTLGLTRGGRNTVRHPQAVRSGAAGEASALSSPRLAVKAFLKTDI